MTQQMDSQSADVSPNRHGPAWLADLRRAGMARFNEAGFPTTRQEEWRFTNVSAIAKTKFRQASPEEDRGAADALEQSTFGRDAAAELEFVNGHYRGDLSRASRLPR